MIYFDHNASSPMLEEARQAWLEATEKFIGNPSSPHRLGSRAEAALNDARERLAEIFGCDALDIVWTSGATEAANLVLHHFASTNDLAREIWSSSIEHPCVLEAANYYFHAKLQPIPVDESGAVSGAWLRERLIKSGTRPACVVAMAANNETGVIQPWQQLSQLCQEYEIPFFCDATQWVGRFPSVGLGKCSFVCGSAHKFGGPRGVGFLKCPSKRRIKAMLHGGRQEEGQRAGTENVPGVISMITALEARERLMASSSVEGNQSPNDDKLKACLKSLMPLAVARRLRWRECFEAGLLQTLPGAKIVGAVQPRLWNTVSVLMPEAGSQHRWVVKLDKSGFAVSTGSACSSGKEEPSHVLTAMGYSPSDASRVLRFSSGWETSETDWDTLLEGVAKISGSIPYVDRS